MNFIKIGSKVLTEVDRARLERISSCSKLKAEEYCETATKSMLKYCNLLLVSKRFRVFDMPLVKKIPRNWQQQIYSKLKTLFLMKFKADKKFWKL
jgi:hypothetical protein